VGFQPVSLFLLACAIKNPQLTLWDSGTNDRHYQLVVKLQFHSSSCLRRYSFSTRSQYFAFSIQESAGEVQNAFRLVEIAKPAFGNRMSHAQVQHFFSKESFLPKKVFTETDGDEKNKINIAFSDYSCQFFL
jgi:hypothetical protein